MDKTFIDEVTGKDYKTEAALKGAITKRKKAGDNIDNFVAAIKKTKYVNMSPYVKDEVLGGPIKEKHTMKLNCKHNKIRYKKGEEYELSEETVELFKSINVI